MKNIILNKQGPQMIFAAIAAAFIFYSCNKPLPDAMPTEYSSVNNSEISIGQKISTDTSYSFFAAAATKTGQLAQLNRDSTEFTVFLPPNNAFRVSRIPSIDALNTLDVQTLGAIVGYCIIPGKQYLSSDITKGGLSPSMPNEQLPTSITIGQLPIPIPFKLTTFPSVAGNAFYDNNIPVTKADIKLKNGVIHEVAAIVAPPFQTLKTAIDNNPDLSFFRAAIERADSGQTGLSRLDSLLNYPATNMTVLAPDNEAFQTVIFGLAYSYLLQQGLSQTMAFQQATLLSSSPAVFSNPALYSVLPASSVQGILAYHFLAAYNAADTAFEPGIRVFSNNFPTTPTPYLTLINNGIPNHEGVKAQATFAGPFVTNLTFTGKGTFPPGGPDYSGSPAKAISLDNHAVNGVYYVIDKVLFPQ
ncbi:MAG: fasciclin domain-containing protein [Ginsengibacter sp.]